MLEPLERMRHFPKVSWHIISGNHDPHRGNGLWDRVRAAGLPDNVKLHLVPEIVALSDDAALLPAPMRRRSEYADLTEWMDNAATAPGVCRIGLAHGSIAGFDAGGEANNPIAPDRSKRAGLDYLALGDWHRTMQVGPATWYAGTPEADRFERQELGQALVVEVPGAGAPPTVKPCPTGTFRWISITEQLSDAADLDNWEARLRALPDLSTSIIKLNIIGTLPIASRADLMGRLERLEAAVFHLNANIDGLHIRPTLSDLESIDFGGVLREAAETLKAMTEDMSLAETERRRAEEALVQLYVITAGKDSPAGTSA
jgi:DNA repair exonuclease SbcCD nuclease subunit